MAIRRARIQYSIFSVVNAVNLIPEIPEARTTQRPRRSTVSPHSQDIICLSIGAGITSGRRHRTVTHIAQEKREGGEGEGEMCWWKAEERILNCFLSRPFL